MRGALLREWLPSVAMGWAAVAKSMEVELHVREEEVEGNEGDGECMVLRGHAGWAEGRRIWCESAGFWRQNMEDGSRPDSTGRRAC
jgi:hypothetical protein